MKRIPFLLLLGLLACEEPVEPQVPQQQNTVEAEYTVATAVIRQGTDYVPAVFKTSVDGYRMKKYDHSQGDVILEYKVRVDQPIYDKELLYHSENSHDRVGIAVYADSTVYY